MKQEIFLRHEFVDFIPDELEERTIYVSMRFATASHLCLCGCGNKIVTPIRPTDWTLIFDGKTISLDPSIGNWSFSCQSHYWVKNNRVKWAPKWSREEVERGRLRDCYAKQSYFGADEPPTEDSANKPEISKPKRSWWQMVKEWWS